MRRDFEPFAESSASNSACVGVGNSPNSGVECVASDILSAAGVCRGFFGINARIIHCTTNLLYQTPVTPTSYSANGRHMETLYINCSDAYPFVQSNY